MTVCVAAAFAVALIVAPSAAFAANTGLQAGQGNTVGTTEDNSDLPRGYAYTKQTVTVPMDTYGGMVVAEGKYLIASGRDIRDVVGLKKSNAQVTKSNNYKSQTWILEFSADDQAYYIKNAATGKYLTVYGKKAAQNANVYQAKKLAKPSTSKKKKNSSASKSDGALLQQWGIRGTKTGYALYSMSNKKMWLTINKNGNVVVGRSLTGIQKFWLLRNAGYAYLKTGSYTLSTDRGYMLGLYKAAIKENKQLFALPAAKDLSQIFDITYRSGGYYKIVNVNSGMAVTDAGKIVQRPYGNPKTVKQRKKSTVVYSGDNPAQLWKPQLQADGKVKFINKRTGRALTCGGCSAWNVSPTASGISVTGKKALWKANEKTSPTKYTIMVDLKWHELFVFQKVKSSTQGGPWKLVGNWRVSTGAPGSRTPARDMKVGHHSYNSGIYNCFYWTTLGYTNFHSVLYNSTRSPNRITDGRLGVNISHGCIRMALENAKWIYDHCHHGTTVKTYY